MSVLNVCISVQNVIISVLNVKNMLIKNLKSLKYNTTILSESARKHNGNI
jgi:hypothetical protein